MRFGLCVSVRDDEGDHVLFDDAVLNDHTCATTVTLDKEFWVDKTFGKWRFDLRFVVGPMDHPFEHDDKKPGHIISLFDALLPTEAPPQAEASSLDLRDVVAFPRWVCRHVRAGQYNMGMRWKDESVHGCNAPGGMENALLNSTCTQMVRSCRIWPAALGALRITLVLRWAHPAASNGTEHLDGAQGLSDGREMGPRSFSIPGFIWNVPAFRLDFSWLGHKMV